MRGRIEPVVCHFTGATLTGATGAEVGAAGTKLITDGAAAPGAISIVGGAGGRTGVILHPVNDISRLSFAAGRTEIVHGTAAAVGIVFQIDKRAGAVPADTAGEQERGDDGEGLHGIFLGAGIRVDGGMTVLSGSTPVAAATATATLCWRLL